MCNDSAVKESTKLLQHLENIWQRRTEWCLAYRSDVIIRGNNINTYTEASIRVLKNMVLQRCMVFNKCALVDFITSIFENYLSRRLLEFANMRHNKLHLYAEFLNVKENFHVYRVNSSEFIVSSSSDEQKFYTINTNVAFCYCVSGSSGSICKHLYAAEKKYGLVLKNSPKVLAGDRIIFAKLALGDEIKENSYCNMVNDDLIQPEGSIQINGRS